MRCSSLTSVSLALALSCCGLSPTHWSDLSSTRAELLRWEVTGQVLELLDEDPTYFGPDGKFGDVRVGDPVRGVVYYDTQLPPIEEPDDPYEGGYYESEFGMPGPILVVENPREQTELTFGVSEDEAEFSAYFAEVYNDYFDEFLGESIDELYLDYLVDEPLDFEEIEEFFLLPLVSYFFAGQNPIDDVSLPTELSREDWPLAEVTFTLLEFDFEFEPEDEDEFEDFFEGFYPLAGIYAEIYTITPIEARLTPGDVNEDGAVDGADLLALQRGEMTLESLSAWETNFGATSGGLVNLAAEAPEPSSLGLLLLAAVALVLSLRRQWAMRSAKIA